MRPWGDDDGAAEALIIGAGDGSLHIWHSQLLNDGDDGVILKEILHIPQAHQDVITCLDVDWERGRIVTGCQDATLRFWEIER